jgi:dihydroxy-acid dehydratase
MRRKLTTYGDPAFSLFLRRGFIKAMGLSDDALDRPIVGITNTYSDYNPCHGNVPQLIEAVKRGTLLGGALPMVFPTISIHESFAHPTSMFLRNLMAMETEEMIRAQPMDAVVLIGGCDKTLPAQLMAAASGDVPAIFLPVGPMAVGNHNGEVIGACTDCRRYWSAFRAGTIDQAEISAINDAMVPSVGTCTVMGTASTMACLTEAMGLCLPMGGSAPATSAERFRLAESTGREAARLAMGNAPLLRDVVSDKSLRNAMIVLQALGGSTNGIVHLAAVAGRLGRKFDLGELDRIGRKVPVLVDLKPSGEHYMEHFHRAGGVPRLMKELASELALDAQTIFNGVVGDIIQATIDVPAQQTIRSTTDPIRPEGAIAILRGNLAPRGAVIKQSAASKRLLKHQGRAVVFDSLMDLAARIDDPNLQVEADDVLVLRNAGPKGAPGMPEAGYLPIPRKLAQQGVTDMVRISDARMSGTAFGTVVLHMSPEATDGGPLAIVRTGDLISLDVENRTLDLGIDAAEFRARMDALHAEAPVIAPTDGDGHSRGYARLYQESVMQADEGADFDFLTGPSHDGPVSPG